MTYFFVLSPHMCRISAPEAFLSWLQQRRRHILKKFNGWWAISAQSVQFQHCFNGCCWNLWSKRFFSELVGLKLVQLKFGHVKSDRSKNDRKYFRTPPFCTLWNAVLCAQNENSWKLIFDYAIACVNKFLKNWNYCL